MQRISRSLDELRTMVELPERAVVVPWSLANSQSASSIGWPCAVSVSMRSEWVLPCVIEAQPEHKTTSKAAPATNFDIAVPPEGFFVVADCLRPCPPSSPGQN